MRPTSLRGARTHNLKGVDLDLFPGTLVVICGPSGSGKSSLATATLYAEGQRRYVESFSAYARQFLERLPRPDVESLEPIAASIMVGRQATVRTSRSTVGTMTDLMDYAKELWAKCARLECPGCGQEVFRDDPQKVAKTLSAGGQAQVITYRVTAEVSDPEVFLGVREDLLSEGYGKVWLEDRVQRLESIRPSQIAAGGLEVVIDRVQTKDGKSSRLVEALESAMTRGEGEATVRAEGEPVRRFSTALRCADCELDFKPAHPAMFSFNSPVGACEECRGFGRTIGVDWDKVLPNHDKTLKGGAIRPWSGKSKAWERRYLKEHAALAGVPLDVPLSDLSESQMSWLIEGDGGRFPKAWVGLRGWFDWLQGRSYKMHVRVLLARYRSYDPCVSCQGGRLKAETLNWKIKGLTIPDFLSLEVSESIAFLQNLKTTSLDRAAHLLATECLSRLQVLADVGLGYLSLSRASRTLSGGESQRVALTRALGASLAGALFVLDEPTVGLHPADVRKLLGVLRQLVGDGNTVLVVEHDLDVIEFADRVIELGPGAGEHGGTIVFDGPPSKLEEAGTATGAALNATEAPVPNEQPQEKTFGIEGATGNNLRSVSLAIPTKAMTCVIGVSGSGKSSLVMQTLVPAARSALGLSSDKVALAHDSAKGVGEFTDVLSVDQSPLARTSRGNAATYVKAWEWIRKRLAATPLACERDYGPGMFSFNASGGRCEACKGDGAETVEMQFLADVSFPCPECSGARFSGPVLDVRLRGLNVAEILGQSVEQALLHFVGDKQVCKRLQGLQDVGLGYLPLGQSLNTLSGGEAQRLKLAAALNRSGGGALLVFDEPTAGLHHDDVTPLLASMRRLVERGDTVVVVEHEMRIAAAADHLIEMGPGAGAAGGTIIAAGTPAQVARSADSVSAPFVRRALGKGDGPEPVRGDRTMNTGNASTTDGALRIVGAREHNLKDVDVTIPRQQLVVVTGPSGSGKSSLAFDVIHAEGQRRYLETLNAYARQYMPQLPRPSVDLVTGIPPTVSLEQRITAGGTNSTVATVTEVSHYLRLVWARAGHLSCPEHGERIEARSPQQLATDVAARWPGKNVTVMAPLVRGRKGLHRDLLARARKGGVEEARIDGSFQKLTPGLALERHKEHDVEAVLGRFQSDDPGLAAKLAEAAKLGSGAILVEVRGRVHWLSTVRSCPVCGTGFPELDPRFFSFNTRQGACATCEGAGEITRKVGRGKKAREVSELCPDCGGCRLSVLARAVTVGGAGIDSIFGKSIDQAWRALGKLELDARQKLVAAESLEEVRRRLRFLQEVGLGYLGLDRSARTLSGGETQRVRLAAQVGSGLTGLLYVLDEPTIGLHPRDTHRLLHSLRGLVDKGNTVLVVEHDEDTIAAADHVIDVGPSGGCGGGRIVATGTPQEIRNDPNSVTGLSLGLPFVGRQAQTAVPRSGPFLRLKGAAEHNLRRVDARFAVGRLNVVTGVSGSGKSTLVRRVLLPALREAVGLSANTPGAHISLEGAQNFGRAVEVDQSPIGRTPRSVPATYVGIWDEFRKLLAGTPEARARGYGAARFSFNTGEGRCPHCKGNGALKAEMAFLPDVHLPCEVCAGARFTRETLAIKLKGHSAGDILAMDLAEAWETFAKYPKIARSLALLNELGLGYVSMGQPSNTLSGGEAQRIKLVSELAKTGSGRTLYVLDEPTTGLHRDDVRRLLTTLEAFVDRGDTLLIIEHHPELIAAADWIVDLGPEGGEGGGKIVVQGSVSKVAEHKSSHTGEILRQMSASQPG